MSAPVGGTPPPTPPASGVREWARPHFAVLFFLLSVAIGLARGASQLADPGIGWHLAAGRLMLQTGHVPRVDAFSFTAAGAPWIDYYWVFEVVSAWLERLGGLPLFTAVWLLVHASIPLLLYRWMVRAGANPLAIFVVLPVAQLVLVSHDVARPHVLTYLFFTLVVARLDDVCAERRPLRSLWWLPLLAILWANTHAGFVVGLGAVGLVAAACGARWVVSREPAEGRRALAIAAVFAAMLLATIVNPYGIRLHQQAIAHLSLPSTEHFDEFQSPDFRSGALMSRYFEVLILGVIAVASLGGVRLGWPEAALLVATLHGAFAAVRNMSLFAIVAAPVVARGVSGLAPPVVGAYAARWRAIAERQARGAAGAVQASLAGAIVLVLALAGRLPFPTTLDGIFLTRGAAAHLAANLSRFDRPFNTIDVAGSLTYRFWPGLRVFVDDRTIVFGEDFMSDYVTVFLARPGWQRVLDRWRVDSAIVPAAAPCATALRASAGWTVDYADDRNVLFVRPSPP